uniref:Uncharacterized protein, contains caspase domain n=1 Tax=Candidatus Kentrum sp. FW TaxID=2126338 RepID=A0A450TJR6_9GAMM|nr:MAG: Uncharacterized protein, contains caspase domain [Candidatus Kentron sp. FW]
MEKIALLIGVSEYPSQALTPLPAAVRDIKALGEVLCHPEMGGFPESNVTLLSNPGRLQMEEAVEILFSGRHRDDLVLLFFSGHGIKDDTGRLYLASRDTRKTTQGELVRASAVAADTVHDYMEYSRCRRQIVILDSCFSGAFPAGLSFKDDGSIDIRAQLGGEGRAILASSSSTQYAFQQDDQDLSVYTRFLLEGIQSGEADRDGDGIITIGELHDYARQKVQESQPAMRPEIYPGKEGYAIRIAQVPVGDPKEKYTDEVAQAMDHRGEIASVAARANLNDWRDRLGLDPATCEAIEKGIMTDRQEEFRNKQQEYRQIVRQILEEAGNLQTEAAHLQKRREMLELTGEDTRKIEAEIEKEISEKRQHHQRNLDRYAALFREAIRQEGSALSDDTQAEMTGIQRTLGLSEEEAEEIQGGVRKEWDTRSHAGAWERGGAVVAEVPELPRSEPSAIDTQSDKTIPRTSRTKKRTRTVLSVTIASFAVFGLGSWYFASKESPQPPVVPMADIGDLPRRAPATPLPAQLPAQLVIQSTIPDVRIS